MRVELLIVWQLGTQHLKFDQNYSKKKKKPKQGVLLGGSCEAGTFQTIVLFTEA